MIFRKYNTRKRDCFVICLPDVEGATTIKMDKVDQIKATLESIYLQSIIDSPPYNYIVYSGGVYEIKSPDIAHTDDSFLSAFNDDIRILVLEKDFLKTRQSEIIDLIAGLSERYSISINDGLVIATLDMTTEISDQVDKIMKESIIKRNEKFPIMSICESVIDGSIVLNNNIVFQPNRDGDSEIQVFANRYSLPLQVLIDLNPHIDPNNVLITDTVFLPSVVAITSRRAGMNTIKYAEYLHELCHHAVREGLKIDG